MAAQPRSTRDHYNPLFLLKNFGESLYVFDKKTRTTKRMSYRSVPAWEAGLETENVWELLWRIDSECSRSINELSRSMNPVGLSEDDRWFISLFAAAEMLRTPKFRNQLKAFLTANPGERDKLEETLGKRLEDTKELANNAQARQILRNVQPYAARLFHMDWAGLKSDKPSNPFWTSDNPVVPYDNLYASRDQKGAFLDTRGIQIFFPISSRFVLLMLMPGYYRTVNVRPVKKPEGSLEGQQWPVRQRRPIHLLMQRPNKAR